MSSPSADGSVDTSQRYVAPDFKRRQLLFDSFTKLGAAGGSSQKNISDQAVGGHDEAGPKGTLLYTWGAGYHGQLGLNTFRKKCRMMPACIDFKEPVLVVACGGFHTAVLTDDGRVYSWGDGRYGQLGNLARKHNMHSTPHLVDWLVSFKVSIVNIACGQYHTAAISNQGKLFTWGSGKWGQLGHGVRLDERFPRKVDAERTKMGNFTKVSCGDRHTAALNDEGRVITFGSGQHGQLGLGNGSDQLKPVLLNDPDGPLFNQIVTSIDCGATTTAAVTSTGLFYLWGFGESIHPKGCSNIQDSPRLVRMHEAVKSEGQIAPPVPVKMVACGQAHILVLTDAGDVYALGMASMGQLGHGSRSNVRTPRLVLRGKEIHQIAVGRYHSMAVSAYGVLYSWGCAESGQGGHNTLETELFPKIVENILPSVVGQISCGEHHSFALTSIAHSTVSADVLNWKLIEDEELKLKRAMLSDVPNGLKSKHILQVEQERKGIIRQLAESLKKEREDNGQFAQLQMSLIRQPEEIVDDVARGQEEALERGDPDAIAQINAMNYAAARLMLTHTPHHDASASNGATSTGVNFAPDVTGADADAADTHSHSVVHSHRGGGIAPVFDDDDDDRLPIKRGLGSSASEAVLPRGSDGRTLANAASSPDLLYEEETKQQVPSSKGKQLVALSALGKSRPVSEHGRSLGSSASTPGLHGAKTLGPLRPSTALSVALAASQKSKARHDMSRTETLDSSAGGGLFAPDSPTGDHRGDRDAQAMVEYAPSLSTSTALVATHFQPLAPRMAFAEQTVKALTWVKNMVAVNPNSANVVNYNVLRLQKQFNALKAERAARSTTLESLKGQLALCRPSPDEEDANRVATERIKQLNMKLVTLNTRLMEAEENKRNYELYIIRMKEEDLQLSKQIEHLRQLVTEYDRLLAKVERMSLRVLSQKGEITEELAHFHADISEFVDFADRTVTNYRAMLNANFKKSQRMDSELERKLDASFDARSSSLGKLQTALQTTDASAQEHKEKLVSWEEKVDYYEKRFRKLTNSTGLSRSEQIVAKHFFNGEITNDLKLDIEHKQDALLALQDQQKALEAKLEEVSNTHTDSRWRDVQQLEVANVNAVNKLLRAKADSEVWAQKVTLVEEGLLQLARAVQGALAKKDGLTPEQQAALVPVGSTAVPSTHGRGVPERGLQAEQLESVVESQFEILLAAVERERAARVARDRLREEQERLQAVRRRALEESASSHALELAKSFITTTATKSPRELALQQ